MLQEDAVALAKAEHRSLNEIAKEALRIYLTKRQVKSIQLAAKKNAKKRGIKPNMIEAMVDKFN